MNILYKLYNILNIFNYFTYRSYLCIDNNKNNNFKYIKFNSFNEANVFYYNNKNYKSNSTIISIYKYIPPIFDKYIINYKLCKMFIIIESINKSSTIH